MHAKISNCAGGSEIKLDRCIMMSNDQNVLDQKKKKIKILASGGRNWANFDHFRPKASRLGDATDQKPQECWSF